MSNPPPRVLCDLCNRVVSPHGHYIVRIDVFADPDMPAVTSEEIEEADYQAAMKSAKIHHRGLWATSCWNGI